MTTLRAPLRAARRLGRRAGATALELAVRLAAAGAPAAPLPAAPGSLFVLRNNDVGDLLVVTPLFAALRRRFPGATIAAGVGSWNLDVLRHNPHVSEVMPVNAPWHNKYQDTAGPLARWAYVRSSPEVGELERRGFEVGIDVLGSGWGSLLLLRAGIPCRLGVQGYVGGHSAAQATIRFDPGEHVGRSALRFAELLGLPAEALPPVRPQLFLSTEERQAGEGWWAELEQGRRAARLVVAPGGGLAAKRWPADSFAALAAGLATSFHLPFLVLGGREDEALTAGVAGAAGPLARTLPRPAGLRQVFGLLAACDLVLCNSSMPLHAAAAFSRPTVALLGEAFSSSSLHQAQWGYPSTSRSLGKEPGERAGLCTPAEALRAAAEILARGPVGRTARASAS